MIWGNIYSENENVTTRCDWNIIHRRIFVISHLSYPLHHTRLNHLLFINSYTKYKVNYSEAFRLINLSISFVNVYNMSQLISTSNVYHIICHMSERKFRIHTKHVLLGRPTESWEMWMSKRWLIYVIKLRVFNFLKGICNNNGR